MFINKCSNCIYSWHAITFKYQVLVILVLTTECATECLWILVTISFWRSLSVQLITKSISCIYHQPSRFHLYGEHSMTAITVKFFIYWRARVCIEKIERALDFGSVCAWIELISLVNRVEWFTVCPAFYKKIQKIFLVCLYADCFLCWYCGACDAEG